VSARRRGRHEVGLVTALVLLIGVLFLVGALADVVDRLGLIILAVALGAGGFAAGRRYERRKARGGTTAPRVRKDPRKPSAATTASFGALPAAPHPSDQLAELERLSGRPIEAILATYQRVARYHGGPR
jgi:hypothetical protein